MAKKEYSLAHTKWMCKYHIIFIPKYRRKVIYNQYKEDIRDIIKQLCSYKGVEIIEGHLMPDHIHMLVSIPPKISVSSFMGYLKGSLISLQFIVWIRIQREKCCGTCRIRKHPDKTCRFVWNITGRCRFSLCRKLKKSWISG